MSVRFPPSPRGLHGLLLALTLLGVLIQPVFAAVHDLHQAEHAALDVDGGDTGHDGAGDDAPRPGDTLDRLLHTFDCCLHTTALPAPVTAWSAQRLPLLLSQARTHLHAPSPPSKLLRPPITA